ncbi:MAG: DUF3267 domain-containing protein [Bacteroidota bacterium]|nr:DUF3267 domain-containing protein [Bacteroidota bacterium]
MKSTRIVLLEAGFQQDAALNHQELIPFVKSYLFRRNMVTLAFLFLTLLFFLIWLSVCIFYLASNKLQLTAVFSWSAFAIPASVLLAPIHELLHGWAYRIEGARKVSYKANWKKLYFMAVADQFITNRKAFHFIALTPFLIISLMMLLLSCFVPPGFKVLFLALLWLHASMCSGDFGLMSYFAENKEREVITYDDEASGISYFYSKKQ